MKIKQFSSLIVTLTMAFCVNARAQDKVRLFASADANVGKAMHAQNNCAACHQQRTEKNEAAFYTRADRKVSTQEKLLAQVTACSAQLKLDLFPEDELNLAAYLNREYYKLK
jgi:cytochrome c553